ncbi:hypothetical protein H4219_003133 [Mycoemilia scoparia]|uniref:Polysaccharide lyase 14 domain-containing protein n=1 Tax=Mycoemilia scoparia TaxID=417184 RepID=A0A9W7ZVN5_9FUNG|nr:hypothetical protein H4219_003133 [Mycoemilia scoparia]
MPLLSFLTLNLTIALPGSVPAANDGSLYGRNWPTIGKRGFAILGRRGEPNAEDQGSGEGGDDNSGSSGTGDSTSEDTNPNSGDPSSSPSSGNNTESYSNGDGGGDSGNILASFSLENINSFSDLEKMNLSPSWGEGNCDYVDDPVDDGGSGGKVLQVTVVAGSYSSKNSKNPGAPRGGLGFYADPVGNEQFKNNPEAAYTFEYDILFPKDFDWVQGGKIPGQYGGTGSSGIKPKPKNQKRGGNNKSCSGGDHREGCFSARHMWRKEGGSEAYMYIPSEKQGDAYKEAAGKYFNQPSGDSLKRGAFKFTAGKWTHIKQTIVVNTGSESNGKFIVSYDGDEVLNIQDMYWGPEGTTVSGVMFHIFFGGGSPQYAPETDQHIMFKNIKYTVTDGSDVSDGSTGNSNDNDSGSVTGGDDSSVIGGSDENTNS